MIGGYTLLYTTLSFQELKTQLNKALLPREIALFDETRKIGDYNLYCVEC